MPTNLTEEQLKSVIDHRGRINKLDSALLFLASSLSIAFALLQIMVGGGEAFFIILPALAIGWFLPFWIGYLYGAIINNSPLDRARGWIYLVLGIGLYGVIIIMNYLSGINFLFQTIFQVVFLGIYFLIMGRSLVPMWVLKQCEYSATNVDRHISGLTSWGAFILTLALVVLSSYSSKFFLSNWAIQPPVSFSQIILFVVLFLMWTIIEYRIHVLIRYSDPNRLPSKRMINYAMIMGFSLFLVGFITLFLVFFVPIYSFYPFNEITYSIIILFIVGGLFSIILVHPEIIRLR